MSILQDLENLSEEELKAVERLIGKFSSRKDGGGKKKKKGPKADKKPVGQDNKPKARRRRRERIITDENFDEGKPKRRRQRGKGRLSPRTEQINRGKRKRGQRRGKGTMATTQAVELSGENKFLKMREKNAAKNDSKIDRALWGDSQPLDRPEEFEYAEVQCKVCDRYFDVNPALVLIDEETGEANYTCDACSKR